METQKENILGRECIRVRSTAATGPFYDLVEFCIRFSLGFTEFGLGSDLGLDLGFLGGWRFDGGGDGGGGGGGAPFLIDEQRASVATEPVHDAEDLVAIARVVAALVDVVLDLRRQSCTEFPRLVLILAGALLHCYPSILPP